MHFCFGGMFRQLQQQLWWDDPFETLQLVEVKHNASQTCYRHVLFFRIQNWTSEASLEMKRTMLLGKPAVTIIQFLLGLQQSA